MYYTVVQLENLMKTDRQRTDRQTDREFNYRGHSNPQWIVGLSGPILTMPYREWDVGVT